MLGDRSPWYDSKCAELKRKQSFGSISLESGNLNPTNEQASLSNTCLDNSGERVVIDERSSRDVGAAMSV